MTPIDNSSTIKAISYSDGTLTVEFKSGGIFHYQGVTQEQYQALMDSESRGKHFHAHFKGKFEFKKQEIENSKAEERNSED